MKKHLLFLIGLLSVITLSAQIIHVPGNNQLTIQDGINAATSGDTVLVAEGLYYENIRFMGKAITVASEFVMDGDTSHTSNTIINGSQATDPDSAAAVMFVNNEDTTSIINGFTITGGSGVICTTSVARIGGGIYCSDAGGKILNNKILENHTSHENKAGGAGIGCYKVSGNYWIIIKNNFISYNSSTATGFSAYGGGIYSAVNTIIKDNTIVHNHCNNSAGMADGGGIEIEQLPGDTIITEIIGNVIHYNVIEGINGIGGGVVVIRSKAKILDNSIKFDTVIAENNGNGGGIWVDTPFGEIGMFSNDISYNTITAGNYGRGGGVVFWNPKAELTLIGNKINNNVSEAVECRGAGVLFRCNKYPTGKIRVIHNEFIGNIGSLDADGCNGGGVCINDAWDTLVVFDGNRFEGNTAMVGGGLFSRRSYNLQLTNNLFINNTSINGGGLDLYHFESDKKMTLHPQIVNNTFYNNHSNYGGGICLNCETNVPVIFNNIFWENDALTGDEIYYFNGTDTLYVAYCDIDENSINGTSPWIGISNINANPEFIEGDSLCHISGGSQCQDSGIEAIEINGILYLCPEYDYEGDPRPAPYGGPDIGADECFYVGIKESQAARCNLQVFPNPSCGISDISYWVPVGSRQSAVGSRVSLSVYDMHGQKIRTMVDENQPAGEYSIRFDGSDLPGGIYFLRLQVGDLMETAKMVLMR